MYSITAVCRLTGLNSSTIRTWERRHGIPEVARAGNGRRLYTEDQVQYLKAVAELVTQGHTISDVAGLSLAEIKAATAESGTRKSGEPSHYHQRLIELLHKNDFIAYRRLLSDAFAFLAPSDVVCSVVSPLMRDIGTLWERGALSIFQEHLATAITKQIMLTAAGSWRGAHSGRRFMFTTLEGDQHEIGLLCAWYMATASNFDTVYLGPSLPPQEIAQAARAIRPAAVVISIAFPARIDEQLEAVDQLHDLLKDTSELWVGCPATFPLKAASASTTLRTFDRFESFQSCLYAT